MPNLKEGRLIIDRNFSAKHDGYEVVFWPTHQLPLAINSSRDDYARRWRVSFDPKDEQEIIAAIKQAVADYVELQADQEEPDITW